MKIENLPSMTRQQLLDLAAKKKIPVKQSLLKKELVSAVRRGLKKIEKKKAEKAVSSKTKKAPAPKKTRTPIKKALAKKTAKAKVKKTAAKTKKSVPTKKAKTLKKVSKKTSKKISKKKSAVKGKARLKVAQPKPAIDPKKSGPATPPPATIEEDQAAKFILGSREIHDEAQAEALPEPAQEYGDHHLVLLPRDPYWAFMYWELQSDRIDQALASLGHPDPVNWVLRTYSPADSRGHVEAKFFDTPIDIKTRQTYLRLSPPGASFIVELGILTSSGSFAGVTVSNAISLPPDRPSDSLDKKWMMSPEEITFHYNETYDEASKLIETNADAMGIDLSNNPTSPYPK